MLISLQINKYAFSGGQDSIENHRKYGANLEVLIFYFFNLPMFLVKNVKSSIRSC